MLETFLADHARRPWRWGETDCSIVLADWAVANGHADAAHDLRGAYDDEAGYVAIMERNGGLVPLVSLCCARIGLERIDEPEVGAIAVIGAEVNRVRQFGAIWSRDGWLVRVKAKNPELAFIAFKARALAIWRVPCLR